MLWCGGVPCCVVRVCDGVLWCVVVCGVRGWVRDVCVVWFVCGVCVVCVWCVCVSLLHILYCFIEWYQISRAVCSVTDRPQTQITYIDSPFNVLLTVHRNTSVQQDQQVALFAFSSLRLITCTCFEHLVVHYQEELYIYILV
jgi:hypothetical protein